MPPRHIGELIDSIYRSESRRILATLIRLLGDFDLADFGTRIGGANPAQIQSQK